VLTSITVNNREDFVETVLQPACFANVHCVSKNDTDVAH